MSRRTKYRLIIATVAVALVAAVVAISGLGQSSAGQGNGVTPKTVGSAQLAATGPTTTTSAPADPTALIKGTNVTFIVASDLHFGANGTLEQNKTMIKEMNAMAGRAWPAGFGGKVGTPLGVIITGDITDGGKEEQWNDFVKLYGLTGKEGDLKLPVYEFTGNHDRTSSLGNLDGTFVLKQVIKRHGSLARSWDWDDVHVVCCDVYPNAQIVEWLKKDLAVIGTRRPVVVLLHYCFTGPFSDSYWWTQKEKDTFYDAIKDYNVVALIHGHFHSSNHAKWNNLDDYLVGSPKDVIHRFLVVNITDTTFKISSWDYNRERWDWKHAKAIPQPAATPVAAR